MLRGEQPFWGVVRRGAHTPVSLRGQREHSLGGAAPRHEAAPTEVGGPAAAAFPDEFLDGEGLDDWRGPQGALLLRALLRGRAFTLQVPKESRASGGLLGLADGQGGLRGAIAEMGVLQRAHILTHPRESHTQEAGKSCSSTGPALQIPHQDRKEIQLCYSAPQCPPSSGDSHLPAPLPSCILCLHVSFFKWRRHVAILYC